MQKREGRSFAAPPTSPILPDLGRTGRKGAARLVLPPQSPLPSLTSALSRRAALFGAVTVASFTTTALPGPAGAGALSANDARLVAIAAELRAVYGRCQALSATHRPAEDLPEWDGLIARFTPLEDEMAELPADTLAGAIAKARALQIPTCRDCARPELGNSLADDLVRLGAGAFHA